MAHNYEITESLAIPEMIRDIIGDSCCLQKYLNKNQDLNHALTDTWSMYVNIQTVTEDGIPIRKLFVSNIAERTIYQDLAKVFSKYGQVESCFLQRTQRRSNYAFITFENVEAAVRARLENITLHNRNLRVRPADSWHQPDYIQNQYYNKHRQKFDKKQSDDQCDQEYIQNDSTDANIQTLNDDCLMHIFFQLPIVDRIRIERVCQRWRALSLESWCNVKKLDLLYLWDSSPCLPKTEINTSILRKILSRCGKFLNEIDLSQIRCPLSESTLTIVAKLCPNLQRIDVTALAVTAGGINSLTNNCHDITKFGLGVTTHSCDRDLQKLFEVNQKLRYFKVVAGKISGACLLHLPLETMEELVLERCNYLRECYLSEAIKKLHNLKSLTIHMCFEISHEVIKAISTHCRNLKTLELSQISFVIQSSGMLQIAQLSNLETLKINTNTVVTDELLSNLALRCQQLTYIDISECEFVTSIGIAALATLPKLEVLVMNSLHKVIDTNLRNMSNLKRLECRRCSFTDKTAIEVIGSAPRLELLDTTWCRGITNLTLKKAAAVTKSRTNTILKIFVGGTTVNLHQFNEVSPFLHIVNVVL
ncbi:putative RNA-binding protein EEED8.10 [Calliopsis andreniformis]|uniref:putative RNA-binding protein EEED8.10 n=1 Tax=Calliopsis andreniformis TaxID=337506 RepID=UPI003FCE3033